MIPWMLTLAEDDLLSHVLPHRLMEKPLFTVPGFHVHVSLWQWQIDTNVPPCAFYISNHIFMTAVAAILMLVVFLHVARRMKPRGQGAGAYVMQGRLAQFFETLLVFIREEVARPALGKITDRYIKFIWTVFFFVLFCNLLGMVPVGPILRFVAGNREHLEHWGGTATGNISVTAGLAIVAFFTIHGIGIREHGLAYFKHFNPGPAYMAPILVPLEIVGSLVKPFALCVRLFANMVAGHLVLAALFGLIFLFHNYAVAAGSIVGAAALSLLELFVAFLQAYIFTFLTVLFIASGAVHEHEHETEKEHAHHPIDGSGEHAPHGSGVAVENLTKH